MLIRTLAEDLVVFRCVRLGSLQDTPEAFGSTYEETLRRGKESLCQRLRLPHAAICYFGAFEDKRLVGIVAYMRKSGAKEQYKGYAICMCVTPEQRRRDIGTALLAEAIARARTVPGLDQLLLEW